MIYIISDIHGCINSFQTMLKKINFSEDDTLICLGDAIDRGKYSFEVLDMFIKNDNMILIKGNHELFFECYLNKLLKEREWYSFGGKYTIQSLKEMHIDNVLKYYNYIHKLPLYYEYNNCVLCHNGFNADLDFVKKDDIIIVAETIKKQYSQHPYNFIISGDIHVMPNYKYDKQIILGHVPTLRYGKNTIHKTKTFIDIDCGATYKGGQLGCLCLDNFEEFYVKINSDDI